MVQGGEAGLARAQSEERPERDVAVLSELAREGEARVAFQGLRRRLELHQEALSRTLRRLEQDGLVARDEGGYKLTEAGFGALQGKRVAEFKAPAVPVVQALLPPHLSPDAIASHLSRRWFRGLRWYGQAEAPGELTLTWLAEPGNAKVRVRVAGSTLTLEVEGANGTGFPAARSVLAALAELYGLDGGEGHGMAGAYGAAAGFAA
ncbi:MAG TPA: MarR family transcriptional regulator [Candidatus Thermoplasmatota archaeon]|jgi:DNA-binding Lrp family transcriptional regulator|nr:MarR family transcriptional regulator [Candidatus Thermoplasmatota archaeon]